MNNKLAVRVTLMHVEKKKWQKEHGFAPLDAVTPIKFETLKVFKIKKGLKCYLHKQTCVSLQFFSG